MTQEEMRREFYALYNMMADSKEIRYMHTFGQVQKEVMEWAIANKPELAQDWLEKLESIKWANYLTPKEAQKIVAEMEPTAPWKLDQWQVNMQQYGYPVEKQHYYNRCALWVTMNMIMSDSYETLTKYVDSSKLFRFVHDLAVDKLTDKDKKFDIRDYFKV
jgi:hypothetical protein